MPNQTIKAEFIELLKEIRSLENQYATRLRVADEAWQEYANASWSKEPQDPYHVQGLKDLAIYHSAEASKVGDLWVQKLSVKAFMLERHTHLRQLSL